jgi:ribonucleoside-diphosphate reductase alpha chain
LAADRAKFVDQAQSVNLFLPADVHKRDLHQLHFQAWKRGLKSLYYCRSKSIQRAEVVATKDHVPDSLKALLEKVETPDNPRLPLADGDENKYEECLACQ